MNGVQFPPEQTLMIKAVPKERRATLEAAVVRHANAVAVHSVIDKDPLHPNAFLIYANYTSAGDARRGQDKLERWLDDKWHWGGRPSVQIRGCKAKAPELTYPPEQTLVLKPVLPGRKELLEQAVVSASQPKNLHSVQDRDESVPGALLMYANYASIDETWRAKQRLEQWLDANWEWANRPTVAIKAAQQELYFGIHVSGLPPGADASEVESFFARFGDLHPYPRVHILANKDGEAFVNFVDLRAAELAIEASRNSTLCFGHSILHANAGRNMERPANPPGFNNRFKHKTQLCRYWEAGNCFQGARCSFAHGAHELADSNSSSPQYSNYSSPQQNLSQDSNFDAQGALQPRFLEQNSGVPQGMGHKPNTQPGSSTFGNASQGLHGLDSRSGFSFGGYPDMGNSNPQMHRFSSSQFPSSQLSTNSQPPFGGSRGDLQDPGEDDVDESSNVMMRMLLGDDDHTAGTGQNNVANMMIGSPPNADLLLVLEWIREAMPGKEGELVAEKFRSEAVDVEALAAFTEEEMKEYGVTKHGPRKKLLQRSTKLLEERKSSAARKIVVPECTVCMEQQVTHAMVPCGHMILCEKCAMNHDMKVCPICTQKIDIKLKIWFV
eukprot:Tamp_02451.p1 GENE.Tamp_02451~~Tamp_02451.p1  ORF type:complete len:610 (-),score=131.87 Tamp_02451:2458-4287(-)